MFELPTVQGLTVCELYVVDEKSKNVTLVNQFTTLKSDRFPTAPKKFSVFAILVNGFGEVPLRLELLGLATEEVLLESTNSVRMPDRLTSVRYAFNGLDVEFPADGGYELALYAMDEPLARCRFRLVAA